MIVLMCFPFNCYHYLDDSKLDKMVLCTAHGVDTQDKTSDLQTSHLRRCQRSAMTVNRSNYPWMTFTLNPAFQPISVG